MADPVIFPAHPERSTLARPTVEWSTGAFATWLLCLLAASTAGIVVTASTTPAESNGDIFESPLLLPPFGVLIVLCALAGWFVPAAGVYWGLVPTVPYLVGYMVQMARIPAEDANFAPLGFVFLLLLMIVPWWFGYGACLFRRAKHR